MELNKEERDKINSKLFDVTRHLFITGGHHSGKTKLLIKRINYISSCFPLKKLLILCDGIMDWQNWHKLYGNRKNIDIMLFDEPYYRYRWDLFDGYKMPIKMFRIGINHFYYDVRATREYKKRSMRDYLHMYTKPKRFILSKDFKPHYDFIFIDDFDLSYHNPQRLYILNRFGLLDNPRTNNILTSTAHIMYEDILREDVYRKRLFYYKIRLNSFFMSRAIGEVYKNVWSYQTNSFRQRLINRKKNKGHKISFVYRDKNLIVNDIIKKCKKNKRVKYAIWDNGISTSANRGQKIRLQWILSRYIYLRTRNEYYLYNYILLANKWDEYGYYRAMKFKYPDKYYEEMFAESIVEPIDYKIYKERKIMRHIIENENRNMITKYDGIKDKHLINFLEKLKEEVSLYELYLLVMDIVNGNFLTDLDKNVYIYKQDKPVPNDRIETLIIFLQNDSKKNYKKQVRRLFSYLQMDTKNIIIFFNEKSKRQVFEMKQKKKYFIYKKYKEVNRKRKNRKRRIKWAKEKANLEGLLA